MDIAVAVLVTINILFLLYNVMNLGKIQGTLSSLVEASNSIGMFIQEQAQQLAEPNTKIQNAEAKKIKAEAKLMEIQGELMMREASDGKVGFPHE